MKEIFNFIFNVFNFSIPVPISLKPLELGYISLFGLLVVFFIIFLMGYIIKKLLK